MSQDLNENDLMFKLLRIYVVEYLSSVRNCFQIVDGYKNIQQQAVNMLALYIIKCINKLVIPTKRLLSLQGVTMPNCLHLINTMNQNKFVDLLELNNFILRQSGSTTKTIQSFYTGLEAICRSLFEQQTQQINQHKPDNVYSNIKYIPHVYLYNSEENPLPIKSPVDEGLKKPAEYTYKNTNQRVEKKLGNYSVREMRRSLGILSVQEQQQINSKQRKVLVKQQEKDGQADKNISKKSHFSMINYV